MSLALGHPKLAKLEEIILDHFVRFQEDNLDDPEASTRVIIFSEYRDSVNEITEMLSQHRPIVRVMSFIGHSSTVRASKGFSQKDQLKVTRIFPIFSVWSFAVWQVYGKLLCQLLLSPASLFSHYSV